MINESRFSTCAAFGAAALVWALNPTAGIAADAITVVSGGGSYAESQIKAYHEPFTKHTGITVNSADYNYELGPIRAQVESGNVTWDVVDAELHAVVRGCAEGLLMPIDPSILPPAPDGTPIKEDFIEGSLHECGVGTIIWSTVYAYDKTKFSDEQPTTIADFFDLEKFPGTRGMKKWPKVNLEFALMADGVPPEQVYEALSTPEGVDRAFAKLDTIKDHVIWWEAGAQPVQLLADGEVAMTTAFNGRVYTAMVDEGQPFEIVWDGQIWDTDMWTVVNGTKNREAALDFVAFASRPERMADQPNYISYGPVRKSAMELVAEEVKPYLPTFPENFETALQNDYTFWADNLDALNVRFNAWLAQ